MTAESATRELVSTQWWRDELHKERELRQRESARVVELEIEVMELKFLLERLRGER